MSAREILEQHAAELTQAAGTRAEVFQEGNRLFIVFHKVALPPDIARVPTTDVLLITDTQYPLSAMDMFWTELEVVRPDGSDFEGSDTIEQYLGRQWRRFSYHRNSVWNPAGNPLMDHFSFVETRWTAKARR